MIGLKLNIALNAGWRTKGYLADSEVWDPVPHVTSPSPALIAAAIRAASHQHPSSPKPPARTVSARSETKHNHPTATMSGAAQGSAATTKAVTDDKSKNGEPAAEKKPAAQLEEDDEFEDFPAEGTQAQE